MKIKSTALFADGALLVVALIWGTANAVVLYAMNEMTPFWFCAVRFAISFVTVSLIFGRRALALPKKTWLTNTLTGMVFICAYLVSAKGIVYTTAGNTAFVVSMSVVFVPLLVWLLTRRFPGWHIVTAVMLCVCGMAGLMLDGMSLSFNFGDMMNFMAMLFLSVYIILVQKFVTVSDPYGLAVWQAFGGMLMATACALIFEPLPTGLSKTAWLATGYAGTVGFALTIVLQNSAQRYATASHAAIILSTQGIFGSVAGIIFLGEPINLRIVLSSGLILLGVLTAEVLPALIDGRRRRILAADRNHPRSQ